MFSSNQLKGSTATEALKDAYDTLKKLLMKRFAEKPEAQVALTQHECDPETWQKPLMKSLTEVQAQDDLEIVRSAEEILKLSQASGVSHGANTVAVGQRNIAIGGNVLESDVSTGDSRTPEG